MKKNTSKKAEKTEEKQIEQEITPEMEVNIEELQQELTDAQASSKESYDKMLRIQAEMENLRKRNTKDVENAHKFALDGFAKALLEVADSISMGIKTAESDGATVESIKDGLEMTSKVFLSTLEKFNIKQINPTGAVFDPEQHEAITMVPSPDMESNTIIEVVQVGFSLNNRIIRPAMVIVAS